MSAFSSQISCLAMFSACKLQWGNFAMWNNRKFFPQFHARVVFNRISTSRVTTVLALPITNFNPLYAIAILEK
jgi:hypothetical protein